MSDFSKVATPTHYVLSDRLCFPKSLNNPSPWELDVGEKYTKMINHIRNAKMNLYVPMEHYNNLSDYNKCFGFCDIEDQTSNNTADITKPRGYWPLTAYKALSIAIFMGYEKLYICGYDNDYFLKLIADEDNNFSFLDEHFFDAGKKLAGTMDGACVGEYLYSSHFSFIHLGKFAAKKIINLDKSSLVTYFTKRHDLDVYK
jgi:hypothetical protein